MDITTIKQTYGPQIAVIATGGNDNNALHVLYFVCCGQLIAIARCISTIDEYINEHTARYDVEYCKAISKTQIIRAINRWTRRINRDMSNYYRFIYTPTATSLPYSLNIGTTPINQPK